MPIPPQATRVASTNLPQHATSLPTALPLQDAEYWVRGLQGRTFHGGDAPDLADLAVFGVIRAVAGTDTFNDLMHGTKIGTWYEAMFKAVGGSARRHA